MLNEQDLSLIKSTRDQITMGRLKPVTLFKKSVAGNDPYTGEPIQGDPIQLDTQAIVKGLTGVLGGEHTFVNGVELIEGDVSMTFDINVDLTGVEKVLFDGVTYVLYSVQPNGLGVNNRQVCIARRAT